MRSQLQPVTLERLGITLDRAAEVPLGVQLVWALRTRVHDGRLVPGERLPALRDLAEGLGVNSNTIRTVYQRLEQEGLIASLQGSGTFVTAPPGNRSAAGAIAEAAAHEARATGIDPREVAAALYVAPEAAPHSGEEDLSESAQQADRRRRLRTRITALEQTLAELEVQNPRLARVARSGGRRSNAGPRLLDTQELEHVQTQLLRRIVTIQTAIDARQAEEEASAAEASAQKASKEPRQDSPAAIKRKARPRATRQPAPTGT
jgi:DNA-binding transcriptional regulator YhcF (GntR family)